MDRWDPPLGCPRRLSVSDRTSSYIKETHRSSSSGKKSTPGKPLFSSGDTGIKTSGRKRRREDRGSRTRTVVGRMSDSRWRQGSDTRRCPVSPVGVSERTDLSVSDPLPHPLASPLEPTSPSFFGGVRGRVDGVVFENGNHPPPHPPRTVRETRCLLRGLGRLLKRNPRSEPRGASTKVGNGRCEGWDRSGHNVKWSGPG